MSLLHNAVFVTPRTNEAPRIYCRVEILRAIYLERGKEDFSLMLRMTRMAQDVGFKII
jgi:hypothetical protein